MSTPTKKGTATQRPAAKPPAAATRARAQASPPRAHPAIQRIAPRATQTARPGTATQPRAHAATQHRAPVAPPVYRPQAPRGALQAKPAQSPAQSSRRLAQASRPAPPTRPFAAAQPKSARPAAPPVYRPQATPKCLQMKASPALKVHGAPASSQRPAPKILQPKANERPRPACCTHAATPRVAHPSAPRAAAPTRPAAAPARWPRGVVQRFVAKDGDPGFVYIPKTVATNATFEKSIEALVGDYTISKVTWEEFRDRVWPGREWSLDKKEVSTWASANLGVGKSPEEQDPAPMKSGDISTATAKKVLLQFRDNMAVYRYESYQTVGGEYDEPEKILLLNPHDMKEAGTLPAAYVYGQACVLQALESFGVNVPETTTSSATEWHTYCVGKGLDYRTDSHYIRLYVGELGYTLKNNVVMRWNDIDWTAMGGNGNYLVSTYAHGAPAGSATGHMIGVVVAGGVVTATHDQQNLTKPYFGAGKVHVRYIFKM